MFPADGKNVKLGKGALFLAPLNDDDTDQGYEFVGNASSVVLASETESRDLYSSTQAAAPLIARNITSISYTFSATLQEFKLENLRKFLQGLQATKPQASASAVTAEFTNVKLGNYYDVGARRISDVTVSVGGTDLLQAGVDYSVNTEFGMVRLLKNATGVNDGDDIVVTFDRPAASIEQIQIATKPAANCRLLFLADDANTDGAAANDRLEAWRCSVSPDGDLPLISDDYAEFGLTITILSDGENHPDAPFGTLERLSD